MEKDIVTKRQWPSDANDLPIYLSPAELAALRGVSTKTLERERKDRSGPEFAKVGKTILYPRDGVLRWLESLTVASLADAQERQDGGAGREYCATTDAG